MVEAILVTLRETWSGYVEGLRLVIPRLLAMLSVVVGRVAHRRGRPRRRRAGPRLAAGRAPRGADRHRGAAPQGRAASRRAPRRLRGLLGPLPGLPPGRPRRPRLRHPRSRCGPRSCSSCRGSSAASSSSRSGLVLANVVWRVVLLAAVNAGWPSARLVGGAVYFLTGDRRRGDGARPRRPRPPDRAHRVRHRRRRGDAGGRHRGRHRVGAARAAPARGAPRRRPRPESDGSSHL